MFCLFEELKGEEKMTLEELRQKPVGVLATREFIINSVCKEEYYLVKVNDEYFVSFLDSGEYYFHCISEKSMVEYMNDKELSDSAAFALYVETPQLSSWLHD